jgi:hypothetical protein
MDMEAELLTAKSSVRGCFMGWKALNLLAPEFDI